MTSLLYPQDFNAIPQDDRNCRADDSGGEVFRNIPKNSSTFRVWKIEVSSLLLSGTSLGINTLFDDIDDTINNSNIYFFQYNVRFVSK